MSDRSGTAPRGGGEIERESAGTGGTGGGTSAADRCASRACESSLDLILSESCDGRALEVVTRRPNPLALAPGGGGGGPVGAATGGLTFVVPWNERIGRNVRAGAGASTARTGDVT